jgi:glycosyltransferase involved in cell wall biosynthesis
VQHSSFTVLHLVSWYPSKGHASLGNFVAEHILAIQTKSKSVVLGAFPADKDAIEYEIEGGVPVCRVYFRKKLPYVDYLKALDKGYQLLIYKGYQFNVAHLHVAYPAGLFLLHPKMKLPFVVTEHFSAYQQSRRKDLPLIQRLLAKFIFNRAHLVLPVSQQLGESLKDFGVNTSMQSIGNVVNTAIFKYQVKRPSLKFRVLHISSLQECTKNISGIVSAFADFHQKFPQSQLRIGGDGDPSELLAHLKKAQLPPDSFHPLPSLSKEEVFAEMRKADCFLLFSHIENQPVVILEALCCGTPVIASSVGGIAKILDSSRGLLVAAGRKDQLIKALVQMHSEHQNYDHKKMAAIAQNEFGYEAIANEFVKVYTSVLRSNASSLKDLNPEI